MKMNETILEKIEEIEKTKTKSKNQIKTLLKKLNLKKFVSLGNNYYFEFCTQGVYRISNGGLKLITQYKNENNHINQNFNSMKGGYRK